MVNLLKQITHNNVIDYVINNSHNLILFFEILAAVTGLVLFNKYKNTDAKYFIYFLVYIVIIVVVGRYSYLVLNDGIFNFLDGTVLERNYWWFTLTWDILAPAFFGFYYSKILNNIVRKKILKTSVIIFLVVSIIIILLNLNLYFTSSMKSISVLGALIILECVFFYFMEILQSDKLLTFNKSLNFYISCAILIFWLIQTPLVFFEQYYRKLDMEYVNLRGFINLFVISFMYITYTIGLIVSKPKYD